MHSTCQRLLAIISILLFFICLIDSSRANTEEHQNHDQALAAVRYRTLQQLLTRRGLYDPAYGDSWSNYFEKKRALFDPAYSDWANSFKRSDE